ncbi:MAG: hypothetical protein QOI27_2853 [Gaiellaceae bacterium]|jgi:hypothetical protein|nr:hypothetical protein [Gaiellaceae bacterium]MDX6468886.1 hypothetical protein [Gaiellaceae bacterium]MDX6471765.1 hypothetical protein [Gaiellaceae bacterium]
MAGKAAVLLVALALAGATPSAVAAKGPRAGGGSGTAPPAAVPSAGRPSPESRNVQPRSGAAPSFGGESDLAGLILYALVAIVVLVVVPAQIAKGIAGRRRVLSRSARAGRRNPPNGA